MTEKLDLFRVEQLTIADELRDRDLLSRAVGNKILPFFIVNHQEQIFKPALLSKPFYTPLHNYAEVYWSHLNKKFFDPNTIEFTLAKVSGFSEKYAYTNNKYDDYGVISPSYLNEDEETIRLDQILLENRLIKCDTTKNISGVPAFFNYDPLLNPKSDIPLFTTKIKRKLASQVLFKTLAIDVNASPRNFNLISNRTTNHLKFAPVIDNEFSLPFLFPDNIVERNSMHQLGNFVGRENQFNACNRLWPKDAEMDIFTHNIQSIGKYYPEIAQDFLDRLNNMREYLDSSPILWQNHDFIGEVNSQKYMLYSGSFLRNEYESNPIYHRSTFINIIETGRLIEQDTIISADYITKTLKNVL